MPKRIDIFSEWRAVTICICVCIGAMQFGYDSSYFSGVLVMDSFTKIYGSLDATTGTHSLSAKQQSLITSIINAGEFVGAVSAFLIGDRFGRRGGLFISSAIVCIGTILQIAGDHLGLLLAGRLVMGYAVGLISCFVPLYVADCAPSHLRGALVSMYQFLMGIGLLLGICVDNDSKDRSDSGSYRIPMGVQFIFPVLLVPCLVLFVPESPRWLVGKGRIPQAEAALRKLRGVSAVEAVEADIEAMQYSAHYESSQGDGSWKEIYSRKPEARKAYLGFALQAFQQGSGINFITGYGVLFFSTVGIKNPFIIQVVVYAIGFPALMASQFLIERFGRRHILLVSGAFMALSLVLMGSLGSVANKTYNVKQAIAATVFIFTIFFNVGWGPTVWVVCSELCTGRNRNKLMSLSTGTNWLFTWAVSFTFPYLYDANAADLGPKIGFIYGSLMICACFWVYILLPETSQRSLEEINEMFEKELPPRKFTSYICEDRTAESMKSPQDATVIEHMEPNC